MQAHAQRPLPLSPSSAKMTTPREGEGEPKQRKLSANVKDIGAHYFVKEFAAFLKKGGKMKVPDWVDIVKMGKFKELAPYDEDWFYIRAASMARNLYIRSPTGVKTFTRVYGGRKRNGTCPSHFCRSSGSIARKILQSLEGIKMVEVDPRGGRRLTPAGRRDMDRMAQQLKAKEHIVPYIR